MDYSQKNSVFMPGLTQRGPVYNLGALPTVSPMIKYGIMAGVLYLGMKKKIPGGMLGGAALAFAVYNFLPSTATAAPATLTTPPVDNTIDTSGDLQNISAPAGVSIATS